MAIPPEIIKQLPAGTLRQLPSGVNENVSREQQKYLLPNKTSKTNSSMDKSTVPKDVNVRNPSINKSDENRQITDQDQAGNEEPSTEFPQNKIEGNEDLPIYEPSIIEDQYRYGYDSLLAREIRQFGYDIFTSALPKPSSLAIPDNNYILGPGDSLLIRVWGSSLDAEYPVVVDREGRINVPQLGPIIVAGTKYGDVEAIVRREAKKYFQGMNISITMVELSSLEVYVVGEVTSPGLHIVPAFSTIFDGLFHAGGIKKTGTLRKIKLYRGKKALLPFDLYDLLLKGDRQSDTMLQNRDVIFVDKIGKTAAVCGAVNHQAIFEITDERHIQDLAKLAGGILPQAFGDRVHLRRFDKNKKFVIQDIDINQEPDAWQKITVKNGDLLELAFIQSALPLVVKVEGNVWKPDIFKYQEGLSLSDVLNTSDNLLPDTLMQFALIYRYDRKTTRTTPLRFPLSEVFTGDYDATLMPHDTIMILSRKDLGIQEEIIINGAVWNPGKLIFQPDLKLQDAVALAGGLKFGAGIDRVEIARQVIKENKVVTEYLLLHLDRDGSFILKPYDSILIPRIKDAALVKSITLTGEVRYPGTYNIRENEKVSDLINRAGGFTDDAYFYGAKYTSEHAKEIQQSSINKMLERLQLGYMQTSTEMAQTATSEEDAKSAEVAGKAVQDLIGKLSSIKAEGRVAIQIADLDSFKNSIYDFKLQDGDTLDIPQKPSFVSVVGSVYSPGSFLFQPDRNLKFYLQKSGGLAKTADDKHVYLLKANGEIISMSQKNGFFNNFEKTVLMPGDTIVVPEDLERVPYLKLTKDISDIVFKIATTAGVALAI
ncbi:SLBB domain-containing protein [Desulfocicer niacini]